MFYLDASVVVANVIAEPFTHVVRDWWKAQPPETLAFSSWTLTETASALSMKVRRRDIEDSQRIEAQRFVRAMQNSFVRNPIDETHFLVARRFADQPSIGLRAGDALHVAIAADYEQTLVTLDRAMAESARLIGLDVLSLLPEG
ncbi:type II toxin-antitoxin system VapC family toxin [soil metagenome]